MIPLNATTAHRITSLQAVALDRVERVRPVAMTLPRVTRVGIARQWPSMIRCVNPNSLVQHAVLLHPFPEGDIFRLRGEDPVICVRPAKKLFDDRTVRCCIPHCPANVHNILGAHPSVPKPIENNLALVRAPVWRRCMQEAPIEDDAGVWRHEQRNGTLWLAAPSVCSIPCRRVRAVVPQAMGSWDHPRVAPPTRSQIREAVNRAMPATTQVSAETGCGATGGTH